MTSGEDILAMAGSLNVFPPPWEHTDPAKQRSAPKRECWGTRGTREPGEQQRQAAGRVTKGSGCQSHEDDVSMVGLSVGKWKWEKRKSFSTVTNVTACHNNGHVCTGSRMTIRQHRALRHMLKQGVGRGLQMGFQYLTDMSKTCYWQESTHGR